MADRRRRCVVAVELFACGLLGADHLRAVRAAELQPAGRRLEADPGRVVIWSVAEPDNVAASHSLIVPSRLADAHVLPSGLKATLVTTWSWPMRFLGISTADDFGSSAAPRPPLSG